MSKVLPVLHDPNPDLRRMSQSVAVEQILGSACQELIANLVLTMKKENGVGIAAPQVGVHERIIIAETEHGPTAFINPELVQKSFSMVSGEEGCLSVPGQWGSVKRHRSVLVKALDSLGKPVTLKAKGLLSIIFQHEIDHLDGILFIDRATSLSGRGQSRI